MDDIKPGDLVRVRPQYKIHEHERNPLRKLYSTPVVVVAVWDRHPRAPEAGSEELKLLDGEDGTYDPWKGKPGVSVWFDNETREIELEWVTKISEINNAKRRI
jgi:hypothetical protein